MNAPESATNKAKVDEINAGVQQVKGTSVEYINRLESLTWVHSKHAMHIDELRHALHLAPAVYFVLRQPLARAQFNALLTVLEERGGADSSNARDAHRSALEVRALGQSRWDMLVSRHTPPLKSVEDKRRYVASLHSVENIIKLRPYTSYTVDGVRYVLDLFNPSNELKLPYAGAGESVLALLLDNSVVRNALVGIDSFYEIVKDIADVLEPEYVRGIHSMAALAFAYAEQRVPASARPWQFLFPLSVLANAELPPHLDWRSLFTRVELWPNNRLLVQILRGFDAALLPAYEIAAHALNMTAVQELVAGTYRPDQSSTGSGRS